MAPPFRRVELSVVVPVRNEQDNIAPLIKEIRGALEGKIDYELIYVDDGSTDATVLRLLDESENCVQLRVLRHPHPFGQSAALMSGVRAARAPWIATLDGDGQNDPADIPRLCALLADPAVASRVELIVGYRRRRRDPWLRRVSSRIANSVRARLLGDRTPDTGCGLKLIRRESYLALPYFDHMHRFLPALVQAQGGVTLSVEVNHRPRRSGTTNYGVNNRLWVGLADLFGVLWLKRRLRRPLPTEELSLWPVDHP